ncbi:MULTISPECIES: acyl-homoserine-lactone synthase [Agrobacterium]|uniref:Autoinducer synthesis protein n=1 Tax=Agrobacterium tumefaciens TaxID=358 RepID=A0AAE6EIA4_AGRTU|nr:MULTISPECIES: acyl-homoserine-lactone synthase [Agrobacterium]QCL76999.1 autoinducer synthesis protein [Agrobacterium tumefaciens]QCL82506.1 autoinducer synthesis protein [Agrobacterium tumefaciens]CUX70966.1 Acyl-homoserine-lactone synthase [Agrobacterium sp. NCPPB 925]
MRILTVPRDQYAYQLYELAQMHRLRATGFRDRLERDVTISESGEFEQHDQLNPTNIRAVVACARRLPTVNRTMSERTFPQLLASGSLNATDRMIESFRVCIATRLPPGRGGGPSPSRSTHSVRVIIEWSMANGYDEIGTAKDLYFECTRDRPRWPITPRREPVEIDKISSTLPTDQASFEQVCPRGYRSIAFGNGVDPAGAKTSGAIPPRLTNLKARRNSARARTCKDG